MSSISPSFTSHTSSNDLSDIAARVVAEFRDDREVDIYDFLDIKPDIEEELNEKEEEEENKSDEEFEFEILCKESNSLNISADEIFSNGEIIPRYPLFDQSLLFNDDDVSVSDSTSSPVIRKRNPLRKLFNEERETASCSSSETDDLDGVSPESYCIWKPKEESPEICKKSNSTGSISKRWKLRNLLRRSHSDRNFAVGKDLSPVTKKRSEKTAKVAGTDDDVETVTVTVTEAHSRGDRLRSVSFKQDLVGVFANVNGLSRNLHPF